MALEKVHAFVISLKSAAERQAASRKQLDKLDINWDFIDAVDGRLINDEISEYPRKKVNRLLGFEMTPSEIGCYLSHKEAWKKISGGTKLGLVFEDDFQLMDTFTKAIAFACDNEDKWEILRCQGLTNVPYVTSVKNEDFSIVENKADPLGATAYLLSPKVAKMLLEASNYIYEPLDHFIEHSQKHHCSIKALLPYPVKASGVETTIPDRPYSERSVRGFRKLKRSFFRLIDRQFSKDPWFKK